MLYNLKSLLYIKKWNCSPILKGPRIKNNQLPCLGVTRGSIVIEDIDYFWGVRFDLVNVKRFWKKTLTSMFAWMCIYFRRIICKIYFNSFSFSTLSVFPVTAWTTLLQHGPTGRAVISWHCSGCLYGRKSWRMLTSDDYERYVVRVSRSIYFRTDHAIYRNISDTGKIISVTDPILNQLAQHMEYSYY